VFVSLLHAVGKRFDSDDCTEMAAQVAFYSSLSVFPFLLVLVSLLGWLPTTSKWGTFAEWLTTYFPYEARRLIVSASWRSGDYAWALVSNAPNLVTRSRTAVMNACISL
jgi:Virulence factor BrkB